MMGEIEKRCADLGTEHCPCVLALSGDCLVCSRLRKGEDSGMELENCECEWSGSCPYTIWKQNGGRISGRRKDVEGTLIQRKEYEEEITVLVLQVGKGFAQKASLPGSFVFLTGDFGEGGGTEDSMNFSMPVSVMKADETMGTIHLAIRREGPKSKWLLYRASSMNDIKVRGPYYSGLLGTDVLRPERLKGKRVLFVTKGIGAAPAILTMHRLLTMGAALGKGEADGGVEIRWLADDRKMDRKLLEDYGVVPPDYTMLMDSETEDSLLNVLQENSFHTAVIAGSPFFVETTEKIIRTYAPETKLVVSNNAAMCCGEGICGACTEVTEDGRLIRRCKCGK